MKYAWELEELDPNNGSKKIPYVVKRLREDDENDLVFKKVFAADWKEGIAIIRSSLDLLEKTMLLQEKHDAEKQQPSK